MKYPYGKDSAIIVLADGLRQQFLGTPIRSIWIHSPCIKDISPLDEEWVTVPLRNKEEMVANRDILEAVIYAISRPRHVTIAAMVIDSFAKGMDYRSHFNL